jgi:hypothetical protein
MKGFSVSAENPLLLCITGSQDTFSRKYCSSRQSTILNDIYVNIDIIAYI